MFSPLTKVLVKIFARGFYRVHAGLFLFFFSTLIVYFFFIEVLNQTHLPPDQVILHNLMLVLTLISSPIMVVLLFVIWFGFTIKSWDYVTGQIFIPSNHFLFYSSTSVNKVSQFKSWFIVQLTISLPILGYGLFSLVVGSIFGYYTIPVIICLFVLLLCAISSFVYINHVNNFTRENSRPLLSRITGNWKKPFFSLFLYHSFDKLKVNLLVTKLLSYSIIAGGFYLLTEADNDLSIPGIITLGITTAHTIIIYQSYRFENSHLSFSRNFPYSTTKLYFNLAFGYWLLTLPENIWMLVMFDPSISILLIIFNLGTGMLFRNILYFVTLDMRKFIYRVFYLFSLFFMIILLKLLWLLVPLNLLFSIIIFKRYYHKQKTFIKT
jgi:hypothetical protein